ncbi:protein-export chaperone SecB [Ferrovibrio sp.]|uniref:protein-export chaperone SecB n=1 Tax=Ferrovibrio sp. TaxID=1917215 RepID=UPI000CBAE1CB|nr:protein-export chaperone SecB [Ferrovibrio sp.]PJI38455.1 MAG: protein-export chaperone SecB [Ferrovibrio sp.]
MTDTANPPPGFDPNADQNAAPHFGLNAQYTKDLSFEHPMAPRTFSMQGAPQISVNVGTSAERVNDSLFEVTLRILCEAKHGEEVAFVIDLHYAGLFTLANIPAEHVEPLLLVEAPRLLFPFARRIVADATRDGGMPPLMLDPIDFLQQYQRSKEAEGQAGTA